MPAGSLATPPCAWSSAAACHRSGISNWCASRSWRAEHPTVTELSRDRQGGWRQRTPMDLNLAESRAAATFGEDAQPSERSRPASTRQLRGLLRARLPELGLATDLAIAPIDHLLEADASTLRFAREPACYYANHQ